MPTATKKKPNVVLQEAEIQDFLIRYPGLRRMDVLVAIVRAGPRREAIDAEIGRLWGKVVREAKMESGQASHVTATTASIAPDNDMTTKEASRRKVSPGGLYTLLNAELKRRRLTDCACRMPLPYRIEPPDDVSANWRIGTPTPCAHGCDTLIVEIAATMWARYDLIDF